MRLWVILALLEVTLVRLKVTLEASRSPPLFHAPRDLSVVYHQ